MLGSIKVKFESKQSVAHSWLERSAICPSKHGFMHNLNVNSLNKFSGHYVSHVLLSA